MKRLKGVLYTSVGLALGLSACGPSATSQATTQPAAAMVALSTPTIQVATVTTAPTSAPTIAPTIDPSKSRMEKGQITSAALTGNLIGDSPTKNYIVYLPPGYDTSGKSYPVVYGIHWGGGNEGWWPAKAVESTMNSLIADHSVRDMIMVFPDASNAFEYSWCDSSPTIGDYDGYISKDLVSLVDSKYRTLASSDSRGIMGCSMGGTCALHLAFRHPDIFGIAVPMSWKLVDYEHDPETAAQLKQFEFEPQTLNGFGRLNFYPHIAVGLAAIAASNPNKPPLYLDQPIRIIGGKPAFVPEVFEKILQLDPRVDVEQYLSQPVRLKGLLLYADNGKWWTFDPNMINNWQFVQKTDNEFDRLLTKRGIQHEFMRADVPHCDQDYIPALKFLDEHLVH